MATADEVSRAAAPRFDYEMAFYAGGKWGRVALDNLRVGAGYDPTAAAVLSADVAPSSTEIPVDSTSGFTTGTVVIAPLADGEEYEVVSYGSSDADSFNTLTREFSGGASGYHTSGAAVTEWVKLDEVTRCALSIDNKEGIVSWSARLEGMGYNGRVLDRDNAILALWRFTPTGGVYGTWTGWTIAFIGYIREVTAPGDYRRAGEWRATVEGIGQYLETSDCPAYSFGRTDLARDKSVEVSSTLTDPYLESTSGEFSGTPSLAGENLVDGDKGTLWISDLVPDSTPEGFEKTGVSINEVYLQAQVGYPDVQWIEVAYRPVVGDADGSLGYYHIVSKATTWGWTTGSDGQQYRIPSSNYIDMTKDPDPPRMDGTDGGFALVVSNRARFEERWSLPGAGVVDWRDREVGTFVLDRTGDFLGLHFFGDSRQRESVVWFGTISPYDYTGDTVNNPGTGWTGDPVQTPARGHSLRRSPCNQKTDPDSAANFVADEDTPTPGERLTGDAEWASIDLEAMGIQLAAELSDVETGTASLNATLGLTESGDVKIDSEVIGYATRDDADDELLTLERGKYGTTPAVHPVDSVVAQYEDSVAYTAPLASSIKWKRRAVYNGSTLVVPQRFDVYVSTSETPIYPDDEDWVEDWEDYWTLLASVADWAAVEWQTSFAALRVRHVLISILDMSDGGRAKLNEVHVYAPTGTLEGNGLNGALDFTWSGDIVEYLLTTSFGLASSQFTLTDRGGQLDMLETTKAGYVQVLGDILRRTGGLLVLGLDETAEHLNSPFYPIHGLPEAEITWTRTNAQTVELSAPFRHNVKQVVLRARNPLTDTAFEVRYPGTPLALGAEVVLDDLVLGSVTDGMLMAEQEFRQRNGQLGLTLVPVGPAEWARPGQRHIVTWDLDTEGVYLSGRNFIVQGVEFEMDFGLMTPREQRAKGWNCTVRMVEMTF